MPSNMIRVAYFTALGVVGIIIIYVVSLVEFPNIDGIMSKNPAQASHKVVVVGGGLAGLSATIEANRHGASVTLIEKEKNLGGNSAKATSGMNGVATEAQHDKNINDSVEKFIRDTISSGDGLSKEDLVAVLGKKSADAHVFLKSFGLGLTDVVQLGGHSIARTHRFPPTADGKAVPVGFTILSTLKKYIENDLKDSVKVQTNALFKTLLMENGKVVGVQFEDLTDNTLHSVHGRVILAGGGYANDHTETSLLSKYVPDLAKLPTTNGPWATGDVIKATADQHLSLIHMDKVQVHPTGFIEPKQPNFHTKFLAPEALRGCGAILLDAEGKRFVNELGRRDYVTQNIFKNCQPYEKVSENPIVSAMLLNQAVIDKFGPAPFGFYKFKGLVQDVTNLAGAAEKLNVDISVLKETIQQYAADATTGQDTFGKKDFPTVFSEDDHFFLAFITPTLHYCMGGIEINANAQVLRKDGGDAHVVQGLYAAGENSGGVHGNNRLGGNSLLECVVFGRIAGQQAADGV